MTTSQSVHKVVFLQSVRLISLDGTRQTTDHTGLMAYTMQWRQLNTETSLITVKKMDFIEQEDFIQQMLEKSILAYVCYLITIESYLSQVHLFEWLKF